MTDPKPPKTFSEQWRDKFLHGLAGLSEAITEDISFRVHIPAVLVGFVLAWLLGVSLFEWLVVILASTIVIGGELFNTALERMARAVTTEEHADIRSSLDIAAGAMLVLSTGAKIVWVIVLGTNLFS